MSEQILTAADWATTRGQQWNSQLEAMEAMLAPVTDPLIAALRLDDRARRIADIGCGGGGATLAIADRAASGSVVHGFDISPVLIARAGGRSAGVEFQVADVSTARPSMVYDRLASRFGVMFFDDPVGAFENLSRWVAPGGRFAFAVWGAPSANPWVKVVKDTVAEIVEVPAVDPDAPGPFRYADIAKLLTLLEPHFCEVEVHQWRGKLPVGGGLPAAEAAEFALESFSAFRDLLNASDAMPQARRLLTERFSGYLDRGVVRMDAWVHIVTGKSQST